MEQLFSTSDNPLFPFRLQLGLRNCLKPGDLQLYKLPQSPSFEGLGENRIENRIALSFPITLAVAH